MNKPAPLYRSSSSSLGPRQEGRFVLLCSGAIFDLFGCVNLQQPGRDPSFMGVIASFAKAVLHGTPLIADGVEGIHSLTLSNAMHLSSWLGETVELPIDEDLYLQELNKRISTSKRKVTESVLFDATGSFSS